MAYRAKPVIVGALLLAMPVAAQAQGPLDRISLGASTTLTSNYLFRGISQTSNDPAIQGSFDVSYDTGGFADVYAGVWASSIEFRGGVSDPASVEIDYYGGLNGTVPGTGITWDLGGIYYSYPDQNAEGSSEFNYAEGTLNLGYSLNSVSFGGWEVNPSIGVGYAGTPDFFGNTGAGHYFNGTMDFGLPYGFGLGFLAGFQDVDDIGSYSHYRIALSKQISKFTVTVSWNDGIENDGFTARRFLEDQLEATLSASF